MPDAYLIPRHYPPGKRGQDRLVAIREEFAPKLGSKRAWVTHVQFGSSVKDLITANGGPTYYFPHGHPRRGEDRYEWKDVGNGVMEGTLATDEETHA